MGNSTTSNRACRASAVALCTAASVLAPGCRHDCPDATLDIAVCDPANGPFTVAINNPYFPLAVGDQVVLEGDEGSTTVRVQITVLNETEVVAGVTTRVVEEHESEDGEVVEISRNYFAQAPDGTVCYFGEAVDDYRHGVVVGHSGAWRAGEGANRPGIIMPASPTTGMVYFQEWAPGIAKDMAEVTATGVTVSTPAGTFASAVEMVDCNPSTGGTDLKFYAPGIGLIVDAAAELISY